MTAPSFTIVVDSREQAPWTFPPEYPTRVAGLATGDYSIMGLEELAAVERKSLPDLVQCCATERGRFKAELLRLRAYRCRAVVIEATVQDVLAQQYRSKVAPTAVLGSVWSWQTRYQVPFVWAGPDGASACLVILRTFVQQVQELAAVVGRQTTAIAKELQP